jgi:uncharacterized protein involved in high-affinity Fe2+ transport
MLGRFRKDLFARQLTTWVVISVEKAHVAREGTARVHAHFKTADGFALGTWVARRRTNYKKIQLDAEKVALLKAVPGWVWDASS